MHAHLKRHTVVGIYLNGSRSQVPDLCSLPALTLVPPDSEESRSKASTWYIQVNRIKQDKTCYAVCVSVFILINAPAWGFSVDTDLHGRAGAIQEVVEGEVKTSRGRYYRT